MKCCDEYGCRRKTPFMLYLGGFTKQALLATRSKVVKVHDDGTATFSATEKHDVTDTVKEFIRRNPEWVREVLDAS